MQRAKPFKLAPRKIVRVCSSEDLIIHKVVAGRPKDLLRIFRQAENRSPLGSTKNFRQNDSTAESF